MSSDVSKRAIDYICTLGGQEVHTPGGQTGALSRPARAQASPCYPAAPAVAHDCRDQWRNDMGLFLGRSFRVCFAANGDIYLPKPCFGTIKSVLDADAGAHQVAAAAARVGDLHRHVDQV